MSDHEHLDEELRPLLDEMRRRHVGFDMEAAERAVSELRKKIVDNENGTG